MWVKKIIKTGQIWLIFFCKINIIIKCQNFKVSLKFLALKTINLQNVVRSVNRKLATYHGIDSRECAHCHWCFFWARCTLWFLLPLLCDHQIMRVLGVRVRHFLLFFRNLLKLFTNKTHFYRKIVLRRCVSIFLTKKHENACPQTQQNHWKTVKIQWFPVFLQISPFFFTLLGTIFSLQITHFYSNFT